MKTQLECLGRGGVDMIEGHSFHLAEMFLENYYSKPGLSQSPPHSFPIA